MLQLAAVDLVDGARLGGMALKSFLLCGIPEQAIKLVGNFVYDPDRADVRFFYVLRTYFSPRPFGGADSNAFLLYGN